MATRLRYIDNALSKGEEYMRNSLSCDSVVNRLDSSLTGARYRIGELESQLQNRPVEYKTDWLITTIAVVVVESINILLLILFL